MSALWASDADLAEKVHKQEHEVSTQSKVHLSADRLQPPCKAT